MSGSTTALDLLSDSQSNKETVANGLFDAMSPNALFGRRPSTSSGLTWGYYGGTLKLADGSTSTIANGTVALNANSSNYIEASAAGVVTVSASAFSGIPLYTVVTNASGPTSWTDHRPSILNAAVQDLANAVSAKYLGATGNGVTDDTANLNLVLASYPDIYFPAGTYIVSTPLNCISNQRIRLQPGAIVKAKAATAWVDTAMFDVSSKTDVEITGPGIIDGNKANSSAGRTYGIRIFGASQRVWVHGLTIREMPSNGTGVNGGDCINVRGNNSASPTAVPTDVWITDNKIEGASRNGISVIAGKSVEIRGNVVDGVDWFSAIDVEPNHGSDLIEDISIVGNKIRNSQGGIFLAINNNALSIQGLRVCHNDIRNCVSATNGMGVWINGNAAFQGIEVSHNHIHNCAVSGIFASANTTLEGFSINANVIEACSVYGIRVASGKKGVVANNQIDQSIGTACIEMDSATECVVSGNVVRVSGNFNGIGCLNAIDVVYSGNVCVQSGAVFGNGIRLVGSGSPAGLTGSSIIGNRTRGFSSGIRNESGVNTIVIGNNTENCTTAFNDTGSVGTRRHGNTFDTPEHVSANIGDAGITLTAGTSDRRQRWTTALTNNRTVTLSTTSAYEGAEFTIVREATSTGAFKLNVGTAIGSPTGPLIALDPGQWADVCYDGSAWFLTRAGSLPATT